MTAIDVTAFAGEWLDNLLHSPPQTADLIPRLIYHDGQAEIAASTAKYKVVACGRRFGKTQFGIDQIVGTILDGFPACYFSPSTDAALEVWETLKRILKPIITQKLEQKHIIRCNTGGYVKLWSYHNDAYERARGQAYKKVVIDEAALGSMSMWEYVIEPMLADYDGECIFLSTPRGRLNWFYELFKRGIDPTWPNWKQFQMPSLRNPDPAIQAFVKDQKKKKTEDVFAQEYGADFTIVSGAVYPTFRESTPDGTPSNVTELAEYDPAYPVLWSCDDGYTNPRVIGLWQQRPMFGIEGCYSLFDVVYQTQELATTSIERLLIVDRDANNNIVSVVPRSYQMPEWVYYDPSAAEFGAVLRSYGLSVWGAVNNVSEGIKVVRRFIQDGNGVRRLFMHPRCRAVIDEMMAYRNPEGDRIANKGGDPNPEKKNDHGPDMTRYLLTTRHLYD